MATSGPGRGAAERCINWQKGMSCLWRAPQCLSLKGDWIGQKEESSEGTGKGHEGETSELGTSIKNSKSIRRLRGWLRAPQLKGKKGLNLTRCLVSHTQRANVGLLAPNLSRESYICMEERSYFCGLGQLKTDKERNRKGKPVGKGKALQVLKGKGSLSHRPSTP